MKCPYCDQPETRVLDSRQTEDGYVIRRRRICDSCGKRFTTYETAEITTVRVVKKDGRREPFSRLKVSGGIIRACEKRPVSMDDIEKMTSEVEQQVNQQGKKEVSSEFVGELVMDQLRKADQVAYIRFASVYRQFADVEKFAEEIDKLRKTAHDGGIVRIAVDGPGGAGKSTVAKRLAKELGYDYIDTGAMYRAVALQALRSGISPEDTDGINGLLRECTIDFIEGKIFLNGMEVSDEIRTPEVTGAASEFAVIPEVRDRLCDIQREIGRRKSVVMDGRDIGTHIFPDAKFKFYLTAAPEERAARRYRELREKGAVVTYDSVLNDVKERDLRDSTRERDPLRKAEDATEIDSTGMTIDEVVERMLAVIKSDCR